MADHNQDGTVEKIRGKVVVRHLRPGGHASTVAVVEGNAVIRVAQPGDPTQNLWPTRATALRAVQHPSLVRLVGTKGQDPASGAPAFIASEYIDGPLLSEVADTFVDDEAGKVMRSLAEAVRAMHEVNVPHGRIHTGQIRLRPDQTPVLLDTAATWGDANASLAGDVAALVTIAVGLPAFPGQEVWQQMVGEDITISELIGALDGQPRQVITAGAAVNPESLPDAPPSSTTPFALDASAAMEVESLPAAAPQRTIYAPEPSEPQEPTQTVADEPEFADALADEPALTTTEPETAAVDYQVPSLSPASVFTESSTAALEPAPDVTAPAELVAAAEPVFPGFESSLPVDEDEDNERPALDDAPGAEDSAPAPVVPTPDFPVVEEAPPLFVEDAPHHAADASDEVTAPEVDYAPRAAEVDPLQVAVPAGAVETAAVVERPSYDPVLVAAPPLPVPAPSGPDAAQVATTLTLTRKLAEAASREQRLRAELVTANAQVDASREAIAAAIEAANDARRERAEAEARAQEACEAARDAEARAAQVAAEMNGAEANAVHLAAAEAAASAYDAEITRLTTEITSLAERAATAEAELAMKSAQVESLNAGFEEQARQLAEANVRASMAAQVQAPAAPQVDAADTLALEGRVREAERQVALLTARAEAAVATREAAERAQRDAEAAAAAAQSRAEEAEAAARFAREGEQVARQQSAALGRVIAGRHEGGANPQALALEAELTATRAELHALHAALGADGDPGQVIAQWSAEREALHRQVADLTQRLARTEGALSNAVSDAEEARRSVEARSGSVIPVSVAPAAHPVVAVVDPQGGPAGPALVRSLREFQAAARASQPDAS